jgi:hypothetical protein
MERRTLSVQHVQQRLAQLACEVENDKEGGYIACAPATAPSLTAAAQPARERKTQKKPQPSIARWLDVWQPECDVMPHRLVW